MVSQKEDKTSSVQTINCKFAQPKTKKIVEKAMPALLFSAAYYFDLNNIWHCFHPYF